MIPLHSIDYAKTGVQETHNFKTHAEFLSTKPVCDQQFKMWKYLSIVVLFICETQNGTTISFLTRFEKQVHFLNGWIEIIASYNHHRKQAVILQVFKEGILFYKSPRNFNNQNQVFLISKLK